MGTAYTPGLKVTRRTRLLRTRRLPIQGEVLVEQGQSVEPDTVVARAELPGDLETVRAADALGVEPSEVAEYLLVKVGDVVQEDQLIAQMSFFFGLIKARAESKTSGTVEYFSEVTGHVGIRKAPTPVDVDAYVAGTIKEVMPGSGVIVETHGALVQGIFGVGGERRGTLHAIASGPGELTGASSIPDDCSGKVLVGGARADAAAIRRAASIGAAALVVGSVEDSVLREHPRLRTDIQPPEIEVRSTPNNRYSCVEACLCSDLIPSPASSHQKSRPTSAAHPYAPRYIVA